MIAGTAFCANAAAGHAAGDRLILNDEVHDLVDLHAHLLQSFALSDRAGHTVKDKALCAVRLSQALLHDADDDIIGHQSTGVHKTFCLFAHRRAFLNGCTQNVAGGNGRDAQLIAEDLCLSSLAGAGGAQKDQFHRTFPFSYSKNPLW